MAGRRKNINLALNEDLVPWVTFAASFYGGSVTAYINDAIQRDSEELGGLMGRPGVAEAWASWSKVNDRARATADRVREDLGEARADALGIDPDTVGPC